MYEDRVDAARRLAERLSEFADRPDVIVLGIPRGGVVLADVTARALRAPLDVLVVRKVGHPMNPEFAAGAVDPDGGLILNPGAGVREREIRHTADAEREEIERRLAAYRPGLGPLDLTGRTALIVDDGIATGLTAEKAVGYARSKGASRVVIAAPVMSPEAAVRLRAEADDVVALQTPALFGAVGQFYARFPQVTDEEVVRILEAARRDSG